MKSPGTGQLFAKDAKSSPYREIVLTNGHSALVDAEDYERIAANNWYAWWNKNVQGYYACRMDRGINGKRTVIYMHREILGLTPGDSRMGDHRFHKTLDNRKFIDGEENLRLATSNENQRNRIRKRKSKTGYKGVSFHRKLGEYVANIVFNNKMMYLGKRKTAKAAHEELYVPAATRLFGKFARFE